MPNAEDDDLCSTIELTANPTIPPLFDETRSPPLDEYGSDQAGCEALESQNHDALQCDNQRGATAPPAYEFQREFRTAALCGDKTTLEALIADQRVDINGRDAEGNSALIDAASSGNVELVRTLLEASSSCSIWFFLKMHVVFRPGQTRLRKTW